GIGKALLRLSGKAHDDVGGDGHLRLRPAQALHHPPELIDAVPPTHEEKDVVVARLGRDVQVAADLGKAGHGLEELVVDLVGVDGTQADPLDPGDLVNPLEDPGQRDGRIQVVAVVPQVHAGEHHFFKALFGQAPHQLLDPLGPAAAAPAAGPRDLAKRAELVAAVLDLHHGAGAAFEVQRRQLLELPDLKDLFDGTNRPAGPKDLLHHVHQLRAPVGAHHHVDAGDGGDLVGRVLYVAPHRDHHGPGIPADGPADHLPGLLRRLIGDAAGVDHVHVRGLVEIDHLVPATPEEGGHALGVVEVYLAAQGRERDPAHPFRAALRPARGRVAGL